MITSLYYTSKKHQNIAETLAQSIGIKALNEPSNTEEPFLEFSDSGLSFFHPEARAKNQFIINFNSGSTGWRLKRVEHEKLIKKALGKSPKPLKILDCTAGLLQDTLLFLSLGHEVTAVEQSKLLFHLLQDGINRSLPFQDNLFLNLTMVQGNACSFAREAQEFDVIYYDPMYPPSKKSALGSGQLEYLSKILEVEQISNKPQMDFEVLQLMPVKKMIVKRPIKAEPFNTGINYQVSGKTTRFDVYI